MANYENLQEQRKETVSLPNPSVERLSIPNIGERRKSSFGIYNRIVLCALDPNPHSRDAFEWYLSNVWRTDDLIVLAYCPETPNFPTISFKRGLTPPVELWKEILEEMNQKTRKLEEEYEGLCVEKKLRYKVRWEAYKNPGDGICKIAEEEKADLIIMGSRGLGMFKRAFMGSVSEYIVRNSGLPCLVVPSGK